MPCCRRVPPRDFIAGSSLKLHAGQRDDHAGADRAPGESRAMGAPARSPIPGQYAVRGGILDLYPPGGDPIRLDFFGDTLESVRAFDPDTQRTAARLESVQLLPMSEMALTPETSSAPSASVMSRCSAPVTGDDPLYESISAGRQHQGMEHWLPLFHERLGHALRLSAGRARHARSAGRRCARTAARADRRPLRRARAGARAQSLRRAALSSRAAREHVPERGGMAGGAFRPPGHRARSVRASARRPGRRVASAAGRAAPSPPSARPKGSTCSMRWWPMPSG